MGRWLPFVPILLLSGCDQVAGLDELEFVEDSGVSGVEADTDIDLESETDAEGDTSKSVDCCSMDDPCELADNGTCDCDNFAGDWDRDDCLPEVIHIDFIGAVIGPGCQDRTLWDLTSQVPAGIWNSFKEMHVATATAESILDFMADPSVQGLSEPDPIGSAEINLGVGYTDQIVLADADTNIEDTFFPSWPMPYPCYDDVALNEDLRIRVAVEDEDFTLNDDIGVAVLEYEDIVQAYLSGDIYYVNVAGQTDEQLLLLSIDVY